MGLFNKDKTSVPGEDVEPADENSKMTDYRETSKQKKHGQDPEDVAERMGTTGDKLGMT